MTKVRKTPSGKFFAFYCGRDGTWRLAKDARGLAIRCETEQLAHSVAAYRRRRLEPLEVLK